MFKIFSILEFMVGKRPNVSLCSRAAEVWDRDPLQHPAIAVMDERELADLPFPRLSLRQ